MKRGLKSCKSRPVLEVITGFRTKMIVPWTRVVKSTGLSYQWEAGRMTLAFWLTCKMGLIMPSLAVGSDREKVLLSLTCL